MYQLLFFITGLCTGSFSNVVIARLPAMMFNPAIKQNFNLLLPRSHCPHCHYTLRAHQLIPVVSWLFLRGKCASCKAPVSVIYPAIELLNALLYLWIALHVADPLTAIPLCLFCNTLLIMAAIDFRHQLLPDVLTLPLLWAGLLWNSSGYGMTTATQALWGAALGYLALWSVYWFYYMLRQREGLGYGDFKLCAALGAWLGAGSINYIILVGSLLGLATWWIRRNRVCTTIPFGPALCGAALLYLNYYQPGHHAETIQAINDVFASGGQHQITF